MSDLLDSVLKAHGGLDRWHGFLLVRACIVTGGELWGIKGLVQDQPPRQMTVALRRPTASGCLRSGGPTRADVEGRQSLTN